ncbi:tape measure protein, partial [Rhodobacteraceae bacterium R_SAG4]|nr:tape measure protein [Rhodobacteraceae bacterium R_SAG4]
MANIRVELQLEDGSFTTGVLRAGQSLAQFKEELRRTHKPFAKLADQGQDNFRQFKKLEEGSGSLLRTMRDVSIVAGGLTLAFRALSGSSSSTLGNIIRVNSEMEKLRYQMAGMSKAADPMADAAAQVENLQDLATKTPFSLGALSTAFVKLKTAGIDPANGSLKALTDGLAAFGASDDQLNRVVLGLSQMSGKGVIQMEELRQQLGESMPSAMKLMARSMGVSVADLTKAISTGRVEAG